MIEHGRTIVGGNVILCGKESAYVEGIDESFLAEARKYFMRLAIVDDLMCAEDVALKVTLCDFKGRRLLRYQVGDSPFQDRVTVRRGVTLRDPDRNIRRQPRTLENRLLCSVLDPS